MSPLCVCFQQFVNFDVMAELPSGLLEACVVVGAPSDKLREIQQVCLQRDNVRCKIYLSYAADTD